MNRPCCFGCETVQSAGVDFLNLTTKVGGVMQFHILAYDSTVGVAARGDEGVCPQTDDWQCQD